MLGWPGESLEGVPCVGGLQGYGPYDYTNPRHRREYLPIVERAHFTPQVEKLIKGNRGSLYEDIDYTLRAFPNHHRALYAMIRYQLREKQRPKHFHTPAECYLQRALQFRPDDGNVHLLYGLYLHRMGHLQEARAKYEDTEQYQAESAQLHYNFGLLLVDLKEYEQAREHAKKAYAAGFMLPGLQRKLKNAGYWP